MKVYTHSKYSYVRVAEIPKSCIKKIDFAMGKQPCETLLSFYNRQSEKPAILSNLGFFNMSNGTTCFNYINDGKVIAKVADCKEGFGVIGDFDLQYGKMDDKNWRDFCSAYPMLIKDGQKLAITYAKELNYKARRTAIGYNDTTIFIVCVENPGMNFNDLQNLMIDLKCTFAMGADGGGSTKMLCNGKSVTKDATNRAVDNFLAVYLKEDIVTNNVDVIYQVYSNGRWLGEVVNHNNINDNGYSGIERKSIQGIKIRLSVGSVKYRVHTVGGKWLPWVTDYTDYAGIIGKNIDAVQVEPIGNNYNVKYRVSTLGSSNYLPWVNGTEDYAGIFGQPIDKVQIYVEKK